MLLLILLLSAIQLKAQNNLFVFPWPHINELEAKKINALKPATYPIIDLTKAITTMPEDKGIDIALVLDAEMNADWLKYSQGKLDKFRKKYGAEIFKLIIYLNNNAIEIDNYSINCFNELPEIFNQYGQVRPSGAKLIMTSDGKLVVFHRENAANYMSNNNTKFLIDGENIFKFVVTKNGQAYAETSLTYSLSKYDPHGTYCDMGKPKYDDVVYNEKIKKAFTKFKEGTQVITIICMLPDIGIQYNGDGIPAFKYNRAQIIYKLSDGKMYSMIMVTMEDYLGGGIYKETIRLETQNGGDQVEIDAKCVEAYLKKYGVKK